MLIRNEAIVVTPQGGFCHFVTTQGAYLVLEKRRERIKEELNEISYDAHLYVPPLLVLATWSCDVVFFLAALVDILRTNRNGQEL